MKGNNFYKEINNNKRHHNNHTNNTNNTNNRELLNQKCFSSQLFSFSSKDIKRLLITICLLVLFTTLWNIFNIHVNSHDRHKNQYSYGISSQSYQEGLAKCAAIKRETFLSDIILRNGIIEEIGLDSWPHLMGTYDINERTDPITPYVRAKDAFSPSDPALRIISSGGVTTSLIIPGSTNVMGGEGHVIKLRQVDTLSVDDMNIYYNVNQDEEKVWRYLKMACGENPKNYFGRKQAMMPLTRLGESWLLRKRFAEAQTLKIQQDDWCDAAIRLNKNEQLNVHFPENVQYESLLSLLRGDAILNIHCYETQDIEAMIRHSWEFDFNIASLHHALDAYRIPEIIKRANSNITIATFSDLWGYKKEAFQASTKSPKILTAKAHHYGLDENLSIAAVTSVPAKALGLDHRIGQISVGYDADIVIWDSYPLSLGATPLEVYIDVYIDENNVIDASHSFNMEEKINILVKDGIIESVGSNLGLSEINAEEDTQDGTINSPHRYKDIIYAVDGLKLGGKHLEVAYKAGVLTTITAPISKDGVISGISVAFKTGAQTVFDFDPENDNEAVILDDVVALHAKIGIPFKNEKIPTVSGQIAFLRKFLTKNLHHRVCGNNLFCKTAHGEIPLIVETHNKDEIASLIKLNDLIKELGGHLRLVILGGSEAHLLATELSRRKIPVVLLPPRPTPHLWSAQNVLVGSPITNDTGIDILYANKVLIGIGVDDPGLAKNLVWDAGWALKNSKGLISEKDAVGFITWNLMKIFGNRANFVAYDGNPFEMGTRVRVIAGGGDIPDLHKKDIQLESNNLNNLTRYI
ncbi:3358_t:CDS:10 [Diversispora eburnea]|uniref:3358_t:CDS:1 n=1 Tax=Diversispora eburnea TaxID=1213867 RepID=A0A9N9B5Z8_9GLOM|nr:3358_t:CDS:10 [Diversispora eburnea]